MIKEQVLDASNKEEILLIGGGGHCHSVIDVIELEDKYKIAGIIDKKELVGKDIFGYKIIGSDGDLEHLYEKYKYAVITIGQIKSADIRIKIYDHLKSIGFNLPSIVSPLAYVSRFATLGDGTIIMHNALVNAAAKIGNNCIINTKALIEHDCIIEDNCHISTSAVLNGGGIVKQNTFFGSNATSRECIKIENFVKAGSVLK